LIGQCNTPQKANGGKFPLDGDVKTGNSRKYEEDTIPRSIDELYKCTHPLSDLTAVRPGPSNIPVRLLKIPDRSFGKQHAALLPEIHTPTRHQNVYTASVMALGENDEGEPQIGLEQLHSYLPFAARQHAAPILVYFGK